MAKPLAWVHTHPVRLFLGGAMTDQEFADFLRRVPREIPEEKVVALGRVHDNADGEYFNQHMFPHHFGEAGH